MQRISLRLWPLATSGFCLAATRFLLLNREARHEAAGTDGRRWGHGGGVGAHRRRLPRLDYALPAILSGRVAVAPPAELGAAEVEAFLTRLARNRRRARPGERRGARAGAPSGVRQPRMSAPS